uniref:Palmitoyltransferase ZDHHC23 n=2 Tax=Culex pipiens TaxID=7175 RepID=A0A8D8G6D6_CULPI
MNSHFASYPGDIRDDCYEPELDTDPLCCCEYYDRNAARNHILACCCNCTDVDESFDSPFPTGTVSRNTIRSNSGDIVGLLRPPTQVYIETNKSVLFSSNHQPA